MDIRTYTGNCYHVDDVAGLDDVIGQTGEYMRDDGAWIMDDAAALWWIDYAARDARIMAALDDAGEDTRGRVYAAMGADLECNQRAACGLLGIEY